MRSAYKCRVYPTPEQTSVSEPYVRLCSGRCGTRPWHGAASGTTTSTAKTSYAQASAHLSAMKATEDLAWLNQASCVPLQQAVRHQQAAFTNFFTGRARCPRFKSRAGRQSAEHTRSGFRYRDGQAAPRQDRLAAGLHVVVAGHRPGLDRPDHRDGLPRAGRPLVRLLRRRDRRACPAARRPADRRRRPRHQGLRRDQRRREDRQPAPTPAQGPGPGPLPAQARPLPERQPEPGQGQGESRPRPP